MQDSDTKTARLESYFDSQPSNLHVSCDTSEDSYSSSNSSFPVETEYSNIYRAEVPSNGIDNDTIMRGIVDRDMELFYMMFDPNYTSGINNHTNNNDEASSP